MFGRKSKGIAPGQSRSRSQIQATTRRLIEVANGAQARRAKAHDMEDTGPTEAAAAQTIAKARNELVKQLMLGCSNGFTPESIISDVIEPILEDAVVSDVAWDALGQALNSVKELSARPATMGKLRTLTNIT